MISPGPSSEGGSAGAASVGDTEPPEPDPSIVGTNSGCRTQSHIYERRPLSLHIIKLFIYKA